MFLYQFVLILAHSFTTPAITNKQISFINFGCLSINRQIKIFQSVGKILTTKYSLFPLVNSFTSVPAASGRENGFT